MSATEEDTELRDLLIQNLENNGVLNKIKVISYLFLLSIFNNLFALCYTAQQEPDKVVVNCVSLLD